MRNINVHSLDKLIKKVLFINDSYSYCIHSPRAAFEFERHPVPFGNARRGVGDMKNGDLAMFHIAANLPETEKKCLNIAMVYNPDEEIGSIYSKEITDRIGCQADHIFVMESAGKRDPAIALQEKVP